MREPSPASFACPTSVSPDDTSVPPRRARRVAAALAIVPLLVMSMLSLGGCTRWFFHPDARLVGTPADAGFDYRDVTVTTADGLRLHAWLIEPAGPALGTIYFLHGNAQNISTHVRGVSWLVTAGYRLFALDYRGYGRSEGRPDLDGAFEDIRAGGAWLLDHLERRGAVAGQGGTVEGASVPENARLHVFGQSLGASLAIRHLEREPRQRARVDSLVVEAAFTRYGAIARHAVRGSVLLRPFGPLAERALAGPHDPLDAIDALASLPLLVVHSPDDAIVPYAFGEALFAAAGEPKTFLRANGPHIAAARDPAVREAILAFLRRPGS